MKFIVKDVEREEIFSFDDMKEVLVHKAQYGPDYKLYGSYDEDGNIVYEMIKVIKH